MSGGAAELYERYATQYIGAVTGLDFNAGMLAVARKVLPALGAAIRWAEGSAVAMELPDVSFDAVLSQQGLQFFPDRRAALCVMRRVLTPGGRVLLSVWRSASPFNIAAAEALERHAGAEVANRYRASRIMLDAAALHSMLIEAGFRAIRVRAITGEKVTSKRPLKTDARKIGARWLARTINRRSRALNGALSSVRARGVKPALRVRI